VTFFNVPSKYLPAVIE